jgi:hypothetical protein
MNPDAGLPLRDIHLPDPVSWWPPAPGWWLLLCLLVIIGFLLFRVIKKIRQPVLKKSAIAEVEKLINNYQQHQNRQLLVQQLSMLVRRIGMSYMSRRHMAGLTGTGWFKKLNSLGSDHVLHEDTIDILSQVPYQRQPEIDEQQIQTITSEIRSWVSSLSRDKKHV